MKQVGKQGRSVPTPPGPPGPDSTSAGPAGSRTGGPWLTRRRLQIALGLLWLLDGALQLQPYMFSPDFVANFLAMNAMDQPHLLGALISGTARFLLPHAAAWNALFAAIQLAIGAGILWRKTLRVALAASFVWTLGVWVVGEGLGSLLTGMATLVGGAPGAVLLYGLIGLLVWPTPRRRLDTETAPVAAEGPLGEAGGRAIWAVLWIGGAILQVLPGPFPPYSVLSATIAMNESGEPTVLAHIDHFVAQLSTRIGNPLELVLAILETLIGVQVLRGGRQLRVYLRAGIVLSLVFWVLGQNFGGILSGTATDPNAGPLYVLLALALYPRGSTTGMTTPANERPRFTAHRGPTEAEPWRRADQADAVVQERTY